METDSNYEAYRKRMMKFPCAFNIITTKVTTAKLRTMKHNLVSELAIDDESDSERIIKLNLLTWVQFCLGEVKETLKLNDYIVNLEGWRNIASIGNSFFIRWQTGYTDDALYFLKHLEKMESTEDIYTLLTDATAEQAYYYSRLGTAVSFQHAIKLHSFLPETPVNYLRRFGLGLVYRRASRTDFVHSTEYKTKATECFFEVAENADDERLRSKAYAELLLLRRSYPKRLSHEERQLFHDHSVDKLCKKALTYGPKVPSVLMQCGIAMRSINIDESIKLLRESVAIKGSSPAYHHLGKSYKEKAKKRFTNNHVERVADEYDEQSMAGGSSGEPGPSWRTHDMEYSRIAPSVSYALVTNDDRRRMSPDQRRTYNDQWRMRVVQNRTPNDQRRFSNDQRNEDTGYTYFNKKNEHEVLEDECENLNYKDLYLPTREKQSYEVVETSGLSTAKRSRHQESEYDDDEYTEETDDVLLKRSISNNEDRYPTANMNTDLQQANATLTEDMNTRSFYIDPRSDSNFRSAIYDVHEHRCDQMRDNSLTQHNNGGRRWKARQLRGSRRNYRYTRNARGNRKGRGARWNDRDKKNVALNKDDENVKQAVECLKKACSIAKENYPALIDLGILLRETEQINDALEHFDNITNSHMPSISHLDTVIFAYEQAGLCYLQLEKTEEGGENKDNGKEKLTMAVSLAANMVHMVPELNGDLQKVWKQLKSFARSTDEKQQFLCHQRKIKVLDLVKKYRDTLPVITQIVNVEDDYMIVKKVLVEYLKCNQAETALAFQNLVAINPGVKNLDWWDSTEMRTLRIKVLLRTISKRLERFSDNPTCLFQQIFELVFGSCIGLCDAENDQQPGTTDGVLGDVLFLFDSDDSPNEDEMCPTVRSAHCLKKLTACLFGLEAEENLKGCVAFKDSVRQQLQRMEKYQVVIIVLGNEDRDKSFDALLNHLKNKSTGPPKHKILVVDTGDSESNIPASLTKYDIFHLDDIGGLGDINLCPDTGDETGRISYVDILTHVFRGNVDAVVNLFCFVIGQTVPLT